MTVEILKHDFVPPHDILSQKEAQEILNNLDIDKSKLPKMLLSDPVAKRLKANLGDIIKITRKSPTAGESFYFRVVV